MPLRTFAADATGDATLRRLWRFRLQFMDLAPDRCVDADFTYFAADVRRDGGVLWLETARDGSILSSMLCRCGDITVGGRSVQWVSAEYSYNARPQRAYPPTLFLAFLYHTVRWLMRPTRPTWYVGPSYLPSFISMFDGISRFWTAGDADLPPEAAELVEVLAPQLCGDAWSSETRLVRLQTRPRAPRARVPTRPSSRRLYARYMAENPEWSDGHTVFVVFPVDARWVAEAAGQSVSRLARWLRGRSSGS